jgi:stage II sporulation protein E
LDSGKTLKYHSKLEKILQENLMRKGFIANEILIYGSEKNITVTLILSANEFSLTQLNHVIDSTLGFKTEITEKVNISENKIYLSFDKQTPYDAVFGVSKVAKDEYGISGDTYSVTKISNNKFLVALSDGMGSGRKAEEISSVSLSLIECFYKAGMNSQSILNTVNKLLSLYTDDCFTALDVCVIDLQTKTTDFIKYGSPYGFIVNDTGVRIIEGNSLPLGILSELKPSVCQDQLKEGDIVTKDTVIGYVGGYSTASNRGGYDQCTSGTHLHFGMAEGHSAVGFNSHAFNPREIFAFPKLVYSGGGYFYR